MNRGIKGGRVAICIALAWSVSGAHGCGPFDFESVLLGDDGAVGLRSPVADFQAELAALPDPPTRAEDYARDLPPLAASRPSSVCVDGGTNVAAIDLAQFRRAMEKRTSGDDLARALEEFSRIRNILRGALPQNFEQRAAAGPDLRTALDQISVPETWPAEFRHYVAGARRFCMDEPARAVDEWEALLALPEAERAMRGIWAAHMVGRVLTASDPDRAVGFLRRVRVLAEEGAEDPLDFATESYGWEARAEWKRGNHERAAALYVLHSRAGAVLPQPNPYARGYYGEPADMALVSLRLVINDLLAKGDDSRLRVAAQNPWFRRVVTLHLLPRSFGYGYAAGLREEAFAPARRWINILADREGGVGADEAVRIAWAAYAAGDYTATRRWLNRAPTPSPDRNWLAGKIALQDGHVEEARQLFVTAAGKNREQEARLSPEVATDSWVVTDAAAFRREQLALDAAITHMGTARFVGALDWFLSSGYWRDAAYVAERVLSVEELLVYVRSHWAERIQASADDLELGQRLRGWIEEGKWDEVRAHAYSWEGLHASWGSRQREREGPSRLQYLLARRLGRELFFKDAAMWYPPALRPAFDVYVRSFRHGHDPGQDRSQRAEDLWRAAQMHRYLGMEFFGAEVAPDNFREAGMFPDLLPEPHPRSFRDGHIRGMDWEHGERSRKPSLTVPLIHPDERWSLRHYGVFPDKRFHYRYVAGDLAWDAAALMPNDTVELARVLNDAGSWIKRRDPQAADRYYKALVLRNWNTPVGQKADRKRWFLTQEQFDALAR